MSLQKMKYLAAQQAALMPLSRDKWVKIAFSTQRINQQQATVAIKDTYTLIGLPEPKIIFCDSPEQAIKHILPQYEYLIASKRDFPWSLLFQGFKNKFLSRKSSSVEYNASLRPSNIISKIQLEIHQHFLSALKQLDSKSQVKITQFLESQFNEDPYTKLFLQLQLQSPTEFDSNFIHPLFLARYCSCLELLTATETGRAKVFCALAENCGVIFPYQRIVVVCDRPTRLCFDEQQRLHAEGEPAIQFADGYSVYAYRGVTLPEKYSQLHPREWETQWILTENNAELRRVLIQGIGYARILEELQAVELDSYQEYKLLKIDSDLDIESIYLLKMVCPSTGHIHVLRVPPSMVSAQDAIAWVNWDINPSDFGVQT